MNILLLLITSVLGQREVFDFIKDVHRRMDYTCATIIIDKIDTIRYDLIDLMKRHTSMVMQIKDVNSMSNFRTEDKFRRGVATLVHEVIVQGDISQRDFCPGKYSS